MKIISIIKIIGSKYNKLTKLPKYPTIKAKTYLMHFGKMNSGSNFTSNYYKEKKQESYF